MSYNNGKHLYKGLLSFIEEYLPNYSSRDDVCELNILYKYIDGEELEDYDSEWIEDSFESKQEVIDEISRLEAKFLGEAVYEYHRQEYEASQRTE